MFYVISCKINSSFKQRTEVFVCPVKWVKGGILYWPPIEKKVQPGMQCKNWRDYKFSKAKWTKYENFKILRNNQIFMDFDEASIVEIEELKNPTEFSDSSTESEEPEDEPCKKSKDIDVQDIINKANEESIPEIMKRPLIPKGTKEVDTESNGLAPKLEKLDQIYLNQDGGYNFDSTGLRFEQDDLNDGCLVSEVITILPRDEEIEHFEHHNYAGIDDRAQIIGNKIVTKESGVNNNLRNIDSSSNGSSYFDNASSHLKTVGGRDSLSQDPPNDSLQQVLNDILSYDESNIELLDQIDNNSLKRIEIKIQNLTRLSCAVAYNQIETGKKLESIINMFMNTNKEIPEVLDEGVPVESLDGLKILDDKLSDLSFRAALIQ
ncbi:hypothetical protein ACFFRR_009046 [Megaselia abdita]